MTEDEEWTALAVRLRFLGASTALIMECEKFYRHHGVKVATNFVENMEQGRGYTMEQHNEWAESRQGKLG